MIYRKAGSFYITVLVIAFFIRRLLWAIPVLFIVATATFLMQKLAPGSPFSKERDMPPSILAQLEAKYQLDGTVWQQYKGYMKDLTRGDLRLSMRFRNRSVNEIIAQTLPVSATLGIGAFILSMGIGISLGIFAAVRHQQLGDRAAMLAALAGISLPSFILAPLCILLFSIWLGVLPVAGWGSVQQYVLPVLCLASPFVASVARLTRSSMLEVLHLDFVRTARAKGLKEREVVYRHALKVGILPVLSYAGPLAANLLTGSMIVEQIFAIPGMGPFFIHGVLDRDLFLVGGIVLVYSTSLIVFNLMVDLGYSVLDRRIRQQ